MRCIAGCISAKYYNQLFIIYQSLTKHTIPFNLSTKKSVTNTFTLQH
jgi:hypothetical protein